MASRLFALGVVASKVFQAVAATDAEAEAAVKTQMATVNENCYDMLETSKPGLYWDDQVQDGEAWSNGFDCSSAVEGHEVSPGHTESRPAKFSGDEYFCQKGSTPSTRGWTCAAYMAKGWCVNGFPIPEFAPWTTGSALRNPEQACCACGGGLCKGKDHCWHGLPGVAVDEGSSVGVIGGFHSLEECKVLCHQTEGCKSLAYSALAGGNCFLKDRCFVGGQNYAVTEDSEKMFRTYYLAQSDCTTEAATAPPTMTPTLEPTPTTPTTPTPTAGAAIEGQTFSGATAVTPAPTPAMLVGASAAGNQGGGSSPWLWIVPLVIALLACAALAAYFLFAKKKKKVRGAVLANGDYEEGQDWAEDEE